MNLERELKTFHNRCEEVLSSRFILAEKKISDLLKSVVLSPVLYRITERCLADFNYEVEFLKVRVADPGTGRYRLALPESRSRLAAFVFCLLCELESKKRDLQRLLEDYFAPDGNCVEGYAAFCNEIIAPYEAVMTAFAGEYEEGEETPAEPVNEKFFGSDFASLSASTMESIVAHCGTISRLTAVEKSFSGQDKQDLQFLLEAFCHALATRDRKLIRALFVGLKNAFRGYKKFYEPVGAIEKTLKELWIV